MEVSLDRPRIMDFIYGSPLVVLTRDINQVGGHTPQAVTCELHQPNLLSERRVTKPFVTYCSQFWEINEMSKTFCCQMEGITQ